MKTVGEWCLRTENQQLLNPSWKSSPILLMLHWKPELHAAAREQRSTRNSVPAIRHVTQYRPYGFGAIKSQQTFWKPLTPLRRAYCLEQRGPRPHLRSSRLQDLTNSSLTRISGSSAYAASMESWPSPARAGVSGPNKRVAKTLTWLHTPRSASVMVASPASAPPSGKRANPSESVSTK